MLGLSKENRARSHKFTPNVRTGSQKSKLGSTVKDAEAPSASAGDIQPTVIQPKQTSSSASTSNKLRESSLIEDGPCRDAVVAQEHPTTVPSPRQPRISVPTNPSSLQKQSHVFNPQPVQVATPSLSTPYHPDGVRQGRLAQERPAAIDNNLSVHEAPGEIDVASMHFVHPTAAVQSKKRGYPFATAPIVNSGKKSRAIAAVKLLVSAQSAALWGPDHNTSDPADIFPLWPVISSRSSTQGLGGGSGNDHRGSGDRYHKAFVTPSTVPVSQVVSRSLADTLAGRRGARRESSSRCEGTTTRVSLSATGPPLHDYFTTYLKKRKHGLGLRLVKRDQRAVVAGFSNEYLKSLQESGCAHNQICPGDIIVAVDNLDTSDPAKCPFDRVVQHLSTAGGARPTPLSTSHPHHMVSSACAWDDDPLNFAHRTSSVARFNDAICIKFARPLAAESSAPADSPMASAGEGMQEIGGDCGSRVGAERFARRFAFGTIGGVGMGSMLPEHLNPDNIRMNYEL